MEKRKNKSVRRLQLVLAVLFLCAGFLSLYLWRQEKREEQVQYFLVRTDKDISEELFGEMENLPGLVSAGRICQVSVKLQVDRYQGEGMLWGVDLKKYPLHIICTAGEVTYGNQLLLVPSEDFLENMTDYNGSKITKAQEEFLKTKLSEWEVWLEHDREGKLAGITAQSGTVILGDWEQVRRLAESEQMKVEQLVWIAVAGEDNQKMCGQILEKARLQMEQLEVETEENGRSL